MCRIIQILVVLFFASLLATISHGQPSSGSKANDGTIIACQFGYYQAVKFNAYTKEKKEFPDLRHTDILIYENNKLQKLVDFRITEDNILIKGDYRYTIAYSPDNQKEDGKYHKIKIVAKTKEGKAFKIKLSIKGYYATKGYFDY